MQYTPFQKVVYICTAGTDRTKYIHIQFALYYVLQVYNRCLNTECTVQYTVGEEGAGSTGD